MIRPMRSGIEFGVELSAQTEAFIASVAAEANFKVSMTWRRSAGRGSGAGEWVAMEGQFSYQDFDLETARGLSCQCTFRLSCSRAAKAKGTQPLSQR